MSFRDNLQHLRSTRDMTQEQLAMLVGVSRQSVTKWEAEKAYPEMDKLLKICQIFGCSLDELVLGDLTSRQREDVLAVPQGAAPQDVCGYDEHMRGFALRMALGIFVIIAGVALGALSEGVNPNGAFASDGALSMLALFAFIALGLALVIPSVTSHVAFQKAHPFVEDFYTSEQRLSAHRLVGWGLALGIGAILLGVVLPALIWNADTGLAAMLFCVAAGVGIIVYSLIMGGRMDLADYNEGALDELSEQEIAEMFEGEEREHALAVKRGRRRLGAICAIIMLVATALALTLLFTSVGRDGAAGTGSRLFWIPWPIGGIACAAVAVWERDLRSKR
ncbi:helix-turn-helix transcriptional regulator [Olsenella urininfantis]|uniref:helix-turn-helix transcriptional regulator n=1 Tax=Olsenella urininfantis TaxID=1871033 RepID=UPI000984A16F|nr:helix-turn-helix transcriptional regulator [Olsenella urininfantis]